MARFDKYNSEGGSGFRAPLAAAYTASENVVGVGLDGNGRVVPGAGTTGIVGVIVKPPGAPLTMGTIPAGSAVDVMDHGEIMEFLNYTASVGVVYTANTTTGVISTAAASATQIPIGFTAENGRLIVRVHRPIQVV